MGKKAIKPTDPSCQLFEFLLRINGKAEVFIYSVPIAEANQVAQRLCQRDVLAPEHPFIGFSAVNGRVIRLNLHFLIGVSRFEIVGEPGTGTAASIGPEEDGPGIHGWPTHEHPAGTPNLALFVDGLEEPLVCEELDPEELELVAMTLEAEPKDAFVHFFDDDNLRTRFIPARSIILMDCFETLEAEPE
jgi:hypothetical protein